MFDVPHVHHICIFQFRFAMALVRAQEEALDFKRLQLRWQHERIHGEVHLSVLRCCLKVDNIKPEVVRLDTPRSRGLQADFRICFALLAVRPSTCRFLHRPDAPIHYGTPVWVGQGSASRITPCRSTCRVWSRGEHRRGNMHILVGLKRTWDQKLSSGLLLKFMFTHFFQVRFADAEQYWLINLTFFRSQRILRPAVN